MIRWNKVSFELPGGMVDESVLIFSDGEDDPRVSLTVTEDDGELPGYIDEIKVELPQVAPGAKVWEAKDIEVAGKTATRMVVELPTQDGPRKQAQVFMPAGAGTLCVITATARPIDFAKAELALESVLRTLAID